MFRSIAVFLFVNAAVLIPECVLGDKCNCPQNCACGFNSRSVVCHNLQSFPKLCSGTESVTIRNSTIKTLSEKDELPTSVRNLIVQRAQTTSIAAGFFKNGSELAVLSLNGNKISEVNWLKNISNLVNLDLSSNRIMRLGDIPMKIKLTHLKLSGNKMRHTDVSSALCRMNRSHLRSLHLDGMELTAFPMGVIGCRKDRAISLRLSFLSLSKNKIEKLPQMSSLKVNKLYLASNKIKQIYPGILPRSLDYLVLANNPLSNGGLSAIGLLTSLKHLDLAGVDSKQFPEDMFQNLSNLEYLSLMRCNLTRIHTSMNTLVNLKTLALQSNKFSRIPVKELSSLIKLENLFLDHNNIIYIEQTDITQQLLYHLKKLGVSHNPFYCGCPILWFSKWIRYSYRTTVIVNQGETRCHHPYNGLRLDQLYLYSCEKGKMHFEMILGGVAIMIIVGVIIGILVCCCRQGGDSLRSSINAKRAKGYDTL